MMEVRIGTLSNMMQQETKQNKKQKQKNVSQRMGRSENSLFSKTS